MKGVLYPVLSTENLQLPKATLHVFGQWEDTVYKYTTYNMWSEYNGPLSIAVVTSQYRPRKAKSHKVEIYINPLQIEIL